MVKNEPMGRVLILRIDPDDGLTNTNGVCDSCEYYRVPYNNPILRVARKFDLSFLMWKYLGDWKDRIDKYDTIIMFDNGYCRTLAKIIKRRNKKCRLILWFWNQIFDENKKYLGDGVVDEIWSYSRPDCEKYHLKYNTQFYVNRSIKHRKTMQWDLLFLGADKGRKDFLEKFDVEVTSFGVKTKIIIPDNMDKYVSYDKYLEMLSESRGILDVISGDNCGLTLRCMEALFFKKKLVTNNQDIINYDFYKPENIFIIGRDNVEDLKHFVSAPLEAIDKKTVEYYSFESWLKRFKEKK